jgi:hypothetical protein
MLALTRRRKAGQIPELPCHIGAFDHARVTGEDLQRHEQYAKFAQPEVLGKGE